MSRKNVLEHILLGVIFGLCPVLFNFGDATKLSPQQCRQLVQMVYTSPMGRLLLRNPKYQNEFDTCAGMLGIPDRRPTLTRIQENSLTRLGDLGKKHFRRKFRPGNIDGCKILLYDSPHLKGSRLRKLKWLRSFREMSIMTVGRCCWTIFKRRNRTGESVHLTGDSTFTSPSQWTWLPGQIKSIKINRKCSAS